MWEYKVVYKSDIADLEAHVSAMLNQGWECVGGLAMARSFAYQAMKKQSTNQHIPLANNYIKENRSVN
jgi:hypothetical protein